MGDFIKRTLRLHGDIITPEIQVRVSWPIQGEFKWECHWEIDWLRGRKIDSAFGIDAVEAIYRAFSMIGAEIYKSPEHSSGHLFWMPGWNGYGFPVPSNLRDRLLGDDATFL